MFMDVHLTVELCKIFGEITSKFTQWDDKRRSMLIQGDFNDWGALAYLFTATVKVSEMWNY